VEEAAPRGLIPHRTGSFRPENADAVSRPPESPRSDVEAAL
jgi:hypothetical protein